MIMTLLLMIGKLLMNKPIYNDWILNQLTITFFPFFLFPLFFFRFFFYYSNSYFIYPNNIRYSVYFDFMNTSWYLYIFMNKYYSVFVKLHEWFMRYSEIFHEQIQCGIWKFFMNEIFIRYLVKFTIWCNPDQNISTLLQNFHGQCLRVRAFFHDWFGLQSGIAV